MSPAASKKKPVRFPEGENWFCVRSKRLQELVCARSIQSDLGMEVFCPMVRFQRPRRTGKVWVKEALFPNYLFARFDFPAAHRRILSSRGVLRIVSFGGEPVTVAEEVILGLRAAVNEEETIVLHSSIKPGEEVNVVAGPFKGLQVLVTRVVPAKKRVAILLELLGMEREVEISENFVLSRKNHPLESR